jgi:methionyl-tRNA formyltransferase
VRVLFFGDGAWAARCLAPLREDGVELAGAVLRRQPSSSDFGDAARTLGLPVYQPERANTPAFVEEVRRLAPDLNLSVAYDQIVRRPLREVAPRGFVNIHAGKLPLYRGRNVLNWALINGETEVGITAHFMDDGIDTGDIVLQRCLPVGWTDTYGEVLARVVDAIPDLVRDTVRAIATDRFERRSQAGLPGTYFGGRGEGDEWLDWSDSSVHLHNKVRAITRPGPGARTTVDGRSVVVWRAFFDRAWPRYIATPGQVVGHEPGRGVLVKTGDSTLRVEEIQLEGRPPEPPAWAIGTRLGVAAGARTQSPEETHAAR